MELHIELVARRMYGEVFFKRAPCRTRRGRRAEGPREGRARAEGPCEIRPVHRRARADARRLRRVVHLPLVSLASKHGVGRDVLEDLPQLKPYLKMLGERPAFRKVNEDRKAAQAALTRK